MLRLISGWLLVNVTIIVSRDNIQILRLYCNDRFCTKICMALNLDCGVNKFQFSYILHFQRVMDMSFLKIILAMTLIFTMKMIWFGEDNWHKNNL
jgi:hypothetical protein